MNKDKLHQSLKTALAFNVMFFQETEEECIQDLIEAVERNLPEEGSMPSFPEDTLATAKEQIHIHKVDGLFCPACDQFVKLYKRKLGTAQCRALILLNYLNTKNEWVHIRKIILQINIHGDFAKMLYWGLIEEHANEDEDKKNSGLWKITEKGKKFVSNELKIPSHAFVYNSVCEGFTETKTDIVEALGKKFSYKELMLTKG